MIGIRKHSEKWRIEVRDETWEFEDKSKMDEILKTLLDMKDNHGNIKR